MNIRRSFGPFWCYFGQLFEADFGQKSRNTYFWLLLDLLVTFQFISALGKIYKFHNPLFWFWPNPFQLNQL